MNYSAQEVMQYAREADVKMIRLAFCDVYGKQKNIVIMPRELERAFGYGIAIDASAIAGFGGAVRSDLILHPDPATLTLLPWRPETGKVVRMFCDISYPDGTPFACDTRWILKQAVAEALRHGYIFTFGPEMEFYLFKNDSEGEPTKIPYDRAGYMDIAPDDKGETVRREICLMMEEMGILPESSHHEEGPGQNEIDFTYDYPIHAADNAVTFCQVVKTVADRNGLCVDFSPKPLSDKAGNGLHINISVKGEGEGILEHMIAGILKYIKPMTLFLNPTESSYRRLGSFKAPRYISASRGNRSQLVRIPEAKEPYVRAEVRSPDQGANPYIAFALLIYAGMEGIREKLPLVKGLDQNLFLLSEEDLKDWETIPKSLKEAKEEAAGSDFIKSILPQSVIDAYLR